MIGSNDTRSILKDYVDILRQSVSFITRSISNNILVFIAILVTFSAAGFALWYKQTPYFESDLVLAYHGQWLQRKTFGEMLHKLDLLATSNSGQELGRQLGISPDQGKSILRVQGKNRAGSPLHEDITDQYQHIYITLRATDRATFLPAEKGIVAYLNSSPYNNTIRTNAAKRTQQKIDFLQVDLAKADSAIDAYISAMKQGMPVLDSIGNRYNAQVLFDHKNSIEENIIEKQLHLSLEMIPSVAVNHGFAPADRPTRGSIRPILAMIIAGLVLGIMYCVLRLDRRTNKS